MTLYLVTILLIPLFTFSKYKYGLLSRLALILLYVLFVYMHIDSGPDHEVYRWYYENDSYSSSLEPLFSLCYILARAINLDYEGFLIAFRFLNAILFSIFVLKAKKESLIFFLVMYIPFSFITFELNLLRQSLSLHFALIAYINFSSNKMKWTFFYIIMAILSHISAIIMLFVFVKKINRKLLLSLAAVIFFAIFNYELIMLKFVAYNDLGDLVPRFDSFALQLLLLLLLPFIFFTFPGAVVPILIYLMIVCFSFIPVLVRLYPIALFFLLPYARFRYSSKFYLVILISISLCLTMMKTYLLIQYDRVGIDTGVIKSGYVK